MIKFNELRITPDGKQLIIDVQIEDGRYYNNMYIDAIIIDTHSTFILNGPSNSPVYLYINGKDNYGLVLDENSNPIIDESGRTILCEGVDKGLKRIKLILDKSDLGTMDNSMYFIYVLAAGTPSPDIPCCMDTYKVMRTAVNLLPIYLKSMNFIKLLEDSCSIPLDFILFILKFKAFELSVKTGNYKKAIEYWTKYLIQNIDSPVTNCNCYGRIN